MFEDRTGPKSLWSLGFRTLAKKILVSPSRGKCETSQYLESPGLSVWRVRDLGLGAESVCSGSVVSWVSLGSAFRDIRFKTAARRPEFACQGLYPSYVYGCRFQRNKLRGF